MHRNTAQPEQKFAITPEERDAWEQNGYFVRYDVFTEEENDILRHTADDIAVGKRSFPKANINQNALVRDGKVEASGIHAMHKIHHVSCYIPEFLARVRDARLTDPIIDLLGPNILGLNNLYIWKSPRIGLGFPWHQDKWYFNHQYKTEMTIGTWTAIDAADKENGCLYVIPGSHKYGILKHEDLEGSQQAEFKIARDAKDEDGVAVEVPPGAVVWFNNQLLHKSTDNHSLRFRRCNVAHYISGNAERIPKKDVKNIRPVIWVRGIRTQKRWNPSIVTFYRSQHPIKNMKPTYNQFSKLTSSCITAAVFALMLTFHTGCSAPLVKALSDINIFTDAEELQFGKAYVVQHEKEVKLYTDPVVTNYINALGQSLVRYSKRSNIPYTFKVVDKKGVNAYAVPGGFIYIHLDLIRMAETESELAFVLGHEIGHIVGQHSMKRLTKIYGIEIVKRIILDEESTEAKKLIAEILAAGLLFRYSRDNERESDFYGVQNIYDAGISPEGAIGFFQTLRNLQKREPSTLEKLISTHPVHNERITNVRSHIKKLPPKSGLRRDSSEFRAIKRKLAR